MKNHFLAFLLMTVTLFVSCKPQIPDEYIKPDDMEDILYDYHIAMAMADNEGSGNRDVNMIAYRQAVLRKHGYTEAQFEESMKYYVRHADRLHDIYENLTTRMSKEAKSQGTLDSEIGDIDHTTLSGDTTNVWKGTRGFLLSPIVPENKYTFSLKADTAYHVGDRLMLSFDSQFIIQEGARNAVAVMAVTLKNDSVVSLTERISSDSHHSLTFNDFGRIGIKQVRGFFIFPPENQLLPSTTLKLLFVNNLKLFRMHVAPAKEEEGNALQSGGSPIRTIGGSAVGAIPPMSSSIPPSNR